MAEPDRQIVRVLIQGRVQGVGFRDWVARNARTLGLDGWVRNRAGNMVEAVFAGPAPAVDRMVGLCRRGPRAAAVSEVQTQAWDEPVLAGFSIGPTV